MPRPPEELLVLACSVRHRYAASWQARATGRDEIHLPSIDGRRLELVLEQEVWSATGAELIAHESDPNIVVVRWWFSGGQSVSYALLVHGTTEPLDGDRFIDIDSTYGNAKEFDFGRWKFLSRW